MLTSLFLYSCAPTSQPSDTPSILDARGFVSATIEREWWIQFILGTAVFVLVISILVFVLLRREPKDVDLGELDIELEEPAKGRRWIWAGGLLLPMLVLSVLVVISLRSHLSLAAPPSEPTTVIEVVGKRWWWEVRYPQEDFVTANEIHIPAGEPVQFLLTSDNVIHSFWVPQLAGKMDLIPGRTNTLWLQADEPGVYRGICAEFCGMQHAKMQFLIIAEPPEEFASWIANEKLPAQEPQDELAQSGEQVFMNSACVVCHTVRGTDAEGDIGPDLTHVANRMTLAAGILENTRGNLAAWVVEPQEIKPGNLMPASDLASEDLQALLAYLESLR